MTYMIVNYDKQFLFVHIQKTGGTSIASSLFSNSHTQMLYNEHTLIKDVPYDRTDGLFKFAFVRNPWDRLYSWYNMSLSKGPINKFHTYTLRHSSSFLEFLHCTDIITEDIDVTDRSIPYFKSIAFNQLDYISDAKGDLNVDFIGRFENIDQDFQFVCDKLNLKTDKLPHFNKFPHAPYRDQYTQEAIDRVYGMYKRDIEYFNYEF